jgi:hypothetical protein
MFYSEKCLIFFPYLSSMYCIHMVYLKLYSLISVQITYKNMHLHTHTHTHIYVYICINIDFMYLWCHGSNPGPLCMLGKLYTTELQTSHTFIFVHMCTLTLMLTHTHTQFIILWLQKVGQKCPALHGNRECHSSFSPVVFYSYFISYFILSFFSVLHSSYFWTLSWHQFMNTGTNFFWQDF